MPTYEYLCASCGHRFETWQRITEDPLTECPECGGHIKRVLFPAGIVFKGSGFYATDSRSPAATSPAEPPTKTESASTAKSESSAPAASPAKTETPSTPTTSQAS